MKHIRFTCLFPIVLLVCTVFSAAAQGRTHRLFRPDKPEEWYTFLEGAGKNSDPQDVFKFEKKVLHFAGPGNGYIATTRKYADFHLTLQFRWGERKFGAAEKEKRNSGIQYHVDLYDGDQIWPRSIEFQVQEGDVGDFWMTDGTTIVHNGTPTPAMPANAYNRVKFTNAERPVGQWNKAEIIVQDGKITHRLNGVVVNGGLLGNTREGQIVLQTEGAEIFFKNVKIRELAKKQ